MAGSGADAREGSDGVKFGWLTFSASPEAAADRERIQDQIALAEAVEAGGFADLWLTEHYFTGESVYSDALTFAAALAMRTRRIRIGFAVVQAPFHHPVRLATQLALLDNLSGGRIDVGLGKGTVYNEYEFVGHGLRSGDARARLAETVSILERIWTEAPFRHRGAFHELDVPEIRPRPVQRPGPPLWRSVISPASFRECGEAGAPILTARLPLDRIAGRWALYAEGLEAGGHDAAERARLMGEAALWRNVYVGRSDAEAEDRLAAHLTGARAHIAHLRRTLNPPDFCIDPAMLNSWSDPSVADDAAVAEAMEHGSIWGGPARVREQVAALAEAGVGHLLCQTAFGAMARDEALAVIRRFSEAVIQRP